MVTYADITQKFRMAVVKPETHGSTFVNAISKVLCIITTQLKRLCPYFAVR